MIKIKNFKKLAVSEGRRAALNILKAGFEAIDTEKAVLNSIKIEKGKLLVRGHSFSLKNARKILIVGIGKCSLEAAGALERILGKRLSGGIVLDVNKGKLKKIKCYACDHPLPTPRNVEATKKIIKLLSSLTENDLVFFIISGGGSAFLCQPHNFNCFEEATLIDCLIHFGVNIQEMNTVRKHLSVARGGYLAKYAYPARVVSFIFSDVVGNNLEYVASGPTIKDTTTVNDAKTILDKYKVSEKCSFFPHRLIETPKDSKYFERVKNILFVSNQTALDAMAGKAEELGFRAVIRKNDLTGEAKEAARGIIDELNQEGTNTVLLYGGETTVKVEGEGRGGRNQELALSALRFIKENQLIISAASDGWDNTDHAGAVCDIITKEKAEKNNLNAEKFLKDNNSYEFFKKTGDYLKTGNTGSNVADIIIAINGK